MIYWFKQFSLLWRHHLQELFPADSALLVPSLGSTLAARLFDHVIDRVSGLLQAEILHDLNFITSSSSMLFHRHLHQILGCNKTVPVSVHHIESVAQFVCFTATVIAPIPRVTAGLMDLRKQTNKLF